MDVIESRYLEWRDHGCVGELTQEEKIDAFYKELEFGTGGLRGKIGEGTNRMNFQTVGRATFGLAEYLIKKYSQPKIAIAYDSRKFSKEFAALAADIMSGMGVEVYLFSTLMPTPVLSYTVRKLGATAGIVITASHNPKVYNGYKVYNERGCQITDEAAEDITAEIEKQGYFNEIKANLSLIHTIGEDVLQSFIEEVYSYSLFADAKKYAPKIVYTPLCGTGRRPAELLFEKMGVESVTVVEEQRMPDAEFSTCPYPNPEEDSALKLAYEYAEKYDAELILATDPDADRVGVAERDKKGNIRRFTGNEVGLILLNFFMERKSAEGKLPKKGTVIKTIVTSDLGKAIAEKYGVDCVDVLTGFKYIGEMMDRIAEKSEFLFGFEESCGYLIGSFARDKDSIGALMWITEAKAYYHSQNKSLSKVMEEIYEEHSYVATHLSSILFEGADGAKKKEGIIASVRSNPITEIVGRKITCFKDYKTGIDGLPISDVMEFSGNGFKFILRPSGTEPKLKIYYFVGGKTLALAEKDLEEIKTAFEKILGA